MKRSARRKRAEDTDLDCSVSEGTSADEGLKSLGLFIVGYSWAVSIEILLILSITF